MRVGRPAVVIGPDAILDPQARLFGEAGVGRDPDAHDDQISGNVRPVGQIGAGHMPCPCQARQAYPFTDRHALTGMQAADRVAVSGAATRCRMRGAASISVTSMPFLRQTAAASSPI